MNYETLFKDARKRTVRSVITGAGEFGTSYIFQCRHVPGLDVTAVCNRTVERGVKAYMKSGIAKENIAICDTNAAVKRAFEREQAIVVADLALLSDLPIDVLVEGTGNPEIGARHADIAIRQGMHVAMVSKEADSVVGPMLFAKARQAGLVYTTVEGDQPSLLIGLITWARVLGLPIICAGKSSEYDFVYDPARQTVTSFGKSVGVSGFEKLWQPGDIANEALVRERAAALAVLPQRAVPDLCEMGIVCNATGLRPSSETFFAPIARPLEISEFLTTRVQGGILDQAGVIDVVNCLRRPDEASLAGGVFVVVGCEDEATWQVLKEKGHLVNQSGQCAAICHPAHLLGIEAPISVLAAALLGHATGAEALKHEYDLVGRATKDLPAGGKLEAMGHHHTIDGVEAMLVKTETVRQHQWVPYYLLDDSRLQHDISAGSIISKMDIKARPDSVLWRLREELEAAGVNGG